MIVSILGEPSVVRDGEAVPIRSPQQRALLAALAMHAGAGRRSDALLDDLWGAEMPPSGRKGLHVLVSRLRATLGRPELVVHDSDGYVLPASEWQFAHAVFRDVLQEAYAAASDGRVDDALERLDRGLALWHGRAFGSLATEDWAAEPARLLDGEHIDAQRLRVELLVEVGRADEALVEAHALVAVHDQDARLRGVLIRALFRAGRQAEAVDACRAAIASARAAGRDSDLDRFRALEGDLLSHRNEFVVRRGPSLPPVPVPRHDRVGRDAELARIRDALRRGVRMVSVVGPGGAGKTRLAMAVARSLAVEAGDIAWVDLSPARSAEDVVATLLTAFGITSAEGDSTSVLVQAIAGRGLCLVLDNFEQVVDSAPIVEGIHAGCQDVRIIVTSRIALGLHDEYVLQLAPFELADDAATVDAGELESLDAVQLFRQRAREVDGVVPEGDEAVRDVHAICRKVDGLALGIELAAARTRLLTPRDIVEQLDRTTAFITSSSTEYPERHRSLVHVIEWSYDLLTVGDQHAFRVLSCFVGGCTLDDFALVSGIDDAAGALERLVSHSLAVRETVDGAPRWRMLETIAAFGRERLARRSVRDDARERFARHMLSIALASNSYTAHQSGAEGRFIQERANVHEAFNWAVDADIDTAADIFVAMDRYLHTRGSMFEGDDLGTRLEPLADRLDPNRRAMVLGLAGRMAHYRGDEERSTRLLDRALRQARDTGDHATQVSVMIWLVESRRMLGELDEAMGIANEARELARMIDDPWRRALATAQHGFARVDKGQGEGQDDLERAAQTFADLGDVFWLENMVASMLINEVMESRDVAIVAQLRECERRVSGIECWTYAAHVGSYRLRGLLELGLFDEAAGCATELVPRVRKSGEVMLLMFALACASVAYLESGAQRAAHAAALESLRIAVQTNATMFAEYSLSVLACTIHQDSPEVAAAIAARVDLGYLDNIYALDRHVSERLRKEFGDLPLTTHRNDDSRLASILRELDELEAR